jgi:uncharacterized Fe-S cluster protein YjdI
MSKRLQEYHTDDITVTFDPAICTHSAVCIRGLPVVFDVRRTRWVQLESASADEVEAQVARCPSGALQCTRTPREERTIEGRDEQAT